MQKKTFLIATGIVVIKQDADDARQALWIVKKRISNRQDGDPIIGKSLQDAFRQGTLNFVVMDFERTQLLCGELNGQFQEPVTRELADQLRCSIPDSLYYQTEPRQ